MGHKEIYTINWHDTDAARELRPSALLTYMQETANRQFEALGRPLDDMRDKEGLGFVLTRITVQIDKPMHAYEQIEVETLPSDTSRGFSYLRGFVVRRGGEVVARAMSTWVLLRVADRTPVRVEEAALPLALSPEVSLELPLRPRLSRALRFEVAGERRIVYSDLDYNLHMNNTHYPDMLADHLEDPLGTRIRGFALSFLHEAAFGITLTVERAKGEEGTVLMRTKAGDTVCLEAMLFTEERKEET